VIAANEFDNTLGYVKNITTFGAKCGENRFVGVDNILQFAITFGCTLTVTPLNAIFARVRLSWTLEEFYADGGANKFVDRLAAALDIHPSTIKVVSVYYGSVNIVF